MSKLTAYNIARGEIGVTEDAGAANNKRVVQYHASTSIGPSDDAVPWCSSFVNWCVEQAGLAGTDSPAARSWLKWGREVATPKPGTIVVLKRGTKPWQGHVGFYVRETDSKVFLLGGNQSNQVKISGFDKDRILGFREPKKPKDSKTIATASAGTVIAGVGAAVQTFPPEILTNSAAIGGMFDGMGKTIGMLISVSLVVIAFVFIVMERLKKINERQI